MSDSCEQCNAFEEQIADMESRTSDLESEKTDLQERVTALEKALDDVLCEINFARADLNDAERIVGLNT